MIVFLGIAVIGFLLYEAYVQNAGPGSVPFYARNAGFSGGDLAIAVAIAYAESAGDPNAIGDINVPVPGAQSVGLWQINTYFHPEYSVTELLDPQTNANAAFDVYQQAGNSFTPWSTFKGGQYLSYLNGAPPNQGTDTVRING